MSTTKAKFAEGDLVFITDELSVERLCARATAGEPRAWLPVSYFTGCVGVVVHVEHHEELEYFNYYVYIRDKMYAIAEWYLELVSPQQEGAPL
jgi:hypothetical protein